MKTQRLHDIDILCRVNVECNSFFGTKTVLFEEDLLWSLIQCKVCVADVSLRSFLLLLCMNINHGAREAPSATLDCLSVK